MTQPDDRATQSMTLSGRVERTTAAVMVPDAVVSVEAPAPAASEKESPLFLLAMFVALGSGVLAPFILIGIVVWKIFT